MADEFTTPLMSSLRQVCMAAFAIALLACGGTGDTAAHHDQPRSAAATSDPEVAQTLATATPTPAPPATPTPVSTPVATPTPAPPAPVAKLPAAPPPPPASTCSASVKFPTPTGGDETVYVASNVPNTPVSVVAHYKTTTHPFTTATDGTGHATMIFSIGRPTPGYTVSVTVTVGSAHCETSFTPQ